MAYGTPVNVGLTHIFGRLFGVTKEAQQRPYSHHDFRSPLTNVTTGSTDVTNNGIAAVSSSSGAWTLQAPVPGVSKRIFATSTSTLVRTFTLASGSYEVGASVGGNGGTVTAGSTYNVITLNGQGQSIELVGRSTSVFAVLNVSGFSTAATIFSTV